MESELCVDALVGELVQGAETVDEGFSACLTRWLAELDLFGKDEAVASDLQEAGTSPSESACHLVFP